MSRTIRINIEKRSTVTGEPMGDSETAEVTLEDEEVDRLRSYHRNAERLRATPLVTKGLPEMGNLNWNDTVGWNFKFSPFDWNDFHAALHVARPLILNDEPASFPRVRGILNRRIQSHILRESLKRIHELFERGLYAPYFQLRTGGIKIFDEEAFKTWIYAKHYHHQDKNIAVIQQVSDAFGEDETDQLMAVHFTGKVMAIGKLSAIVRVTLDKIDGEVPQS